MLNRITAIPWFVWPLFVILVIGGLKARKTNAVALRMLLLIPSIFLCGSIFPFFHTYTGVYCKLIWLTCLGIGFSLGFFQIQRMNLRVDREKMMVIMPGSWVPLTLSMSIFFAKFISGALKATYTDFDGSALFFGLEFFSTFILGIFTGRGFGCFIKYESPETESITLDS